MRKLKLTTFVTICALLMLCSCGKPDNSEEMVKRLDSLEALVSDLNIKLKYQGDTINKRIENWQRLAGGFIIKHDTLLDENSQLKVK